MKQIFDSDYIPPDKNPRVFQDSNLNKSAAFDEALKRYENSLKNDINQNDKHKEFMKQRINSAENDKTNEKE